MKKSYLFWDLGVEGPEPNTQSQNTQGPQYHFVDSFSAVQTCHLNKGPRGDFHNNLVTVLQFAVFRQCILCLSKSRQTSFLFVFFMRVRGWCASSQNLSFVHGRILISDYMTFFCVIVTCISRCQRIRVITITGQSGSPLQIYVFFYCE